MRVGSTGRGFIRGYHDSQARTWKVKNIGISEIHNTSMQDQSSGQNLQNISSLRKSDDF